MRTAFDIVKAHYDASDRRDLAGMLADVDSETQWTEMAGFPCAGTFTGPQAIIENVFKALAEMFDNYTFTLERLLDARAHVVAIGNYTAIHRKTGKPFNARVAHVWMVEGEKVRSFEQFADTLLVDESTRGEVRIAAAAC